MQIQDGPSANEALSPEAERALLRWQRHLLPFMMASLIAMGVFFFAATLWLFIDLQQRLEYKSTDIVAVLDKLAQPSAAAADRAERRIERDWTVRVVLEKVALEQRFNVQTTVVKGRLWTRFMGFLTGMILCLTGCVFVLGKLRESVRTAAEGGGLKGELATSSPGVFMAFAGTIVIGIVLVVPTSVESTDAAVYLPRQVQLVDSEGRPASEAYDRPVPVAVMPAPDSPPTLDGKNVPALPPTVMEKLYAPPATKPASK